MNGDDATGAAPERPDVENIDGYDVPIDPAEELDCASCQ